MGRTERRQKFPDLTWIRYAHRLAGKGQIETVQIHDDRQHDPLILGNPIGHENRIQHFLAGLSVDLQEAGVSRSQHIVVIRFKRNRGGQRPRHVHEHERNAPA